MYSQIGQDDWVLSLFPEGYEGYFLDIGAQLPRDINNTLLLEEKGWTGLAIDIIDFSEDWKERKTPFICKDIFKIDLDEYGIPEVVDYLSLDISPWPGSRYESLQRVLSFGFKFCVVTLEHDANRGIDHIVRERIPQRLLMKEMGYTLVKENVNGFEDWYINEVLLASRAGQVGG